MTKIYHLALVTDWQKSVINNEIYYPPTYESDGFTHGTAEAAKLITVANHFYTASVGDWVCLEMTEASLQETNVDVRFEPAAPVGNQDGTLPSDASASSENATLFPHLYGGIHPSAVTDTFPVTRDATGQFIAIELQ